MTNLAHRRLRAPQEDGTALIDPPLSQAAALVASNRKLLENFDLRAGFGSEFRQEARAKNAVGHQLDATPVVNSLPIVMAGHQPTLFHPGVWLKNFLLSSIAQAVGGAAINLVADNDTIRSASIRVPSGMRNAPQIVELPFDAAGEVIPWEERRILDASLFQSFGARVQQAAKPVLSQTGSSNLIIDRMWDHAVADTNRQTARVEDFNREVAEKCGLDLSSLRPATSRIHLERCISTGRHLFERESGLTTNELPLWWVATTKSFQMFAAHLLARHRELRTLHNAALTDYRLANGIRSRSHPVPDLSQDGEWHEAPFWIWTASDPYRRRVFVRQVGSSWEITDRAGLIVSPNTSESSKTMVAWNDVYLKGVRFRPRALITTMYARLVLSDLFIHGIGGAKYDELTDEIIRRFFGIEPPAYLTATATFRLPIERPHVTAEDVRDVARRIRELRFRPESFLGDPLLAREPAMQRELVALADEKREYLRTHTLRGATREVYAGLDRINRAMHARLRPIDAHLRDELARLSDEAQRSRLLGSREFSFVLFPEEYLVPRLLELSKVPA